MSLALPVAFLFTSLTALLPTPERTAISLDIYNRDLAMVRDTRLTSLSDHVTAVEFTGVTEGIFGHTANVRPLKHSEAIRQTGLTFNYDLISQEKLLQRSLFQWFSFTADDATYQGELLAFDDKHIFLRPDSLSNEIQVVERSKLTEMFYPGFPADLYFRPTLRWGVNVSKDVGELPVEITYLTTGITWLCDYRGEMIGEDSLSLSASFNISNDLQTSFPGAKVSLVVGKPHRSSDPEGTSGGDEVSLPGKGGGTPPAALAPERLGELYRYYLPEPVDLEGFQTIQLPFFSEKRIKIERRYFFPHLLDDQTVASQIRFDLPQSQFGDTPLPEGDIGIYRRSKSGDLLFAGQDFIPITPVGGSVDLTIGQATDITARRMRVAQNRPTRDTSEETWQIEVVNGRREAATVWAEQRVFGIYKVVKAEVDNKAVEPKIEESGRLLLPIATPALSKSTLTLTISYGF